LEFIHFNPEVRSSQTKAKCLAEDRVWYSTAVRTSNPKVFEEVTISTTRSSGELKRRK
jgi:hypothetical protein